MNLGQRIDDAAISAERPLSSTIIEDASVQASMQPWVEMECYQLGQGRQLAQMDILDLDSCQIVREHQVVAVQKLGVTPTNLCTLSYCTADPAFRFSELGAEEVNTVFFLPAHTEYDIYVPAGVQTNYVSLKQDEFLGGARVLNPAQWERASAQLQHIQTARQTALRGVFNLWFATVGAANVSGVSADESLMGRLLLHDILQVATASIGTDESRASAIERSRAYHVYRMARIFIKDNLTVDVVPTVVDICKSVGVSERSLQYAFRRYVDMSPLGYLRLCRLNRVRATLRASHPQTTTVTSIAMRFGFLHLGRFAADYKHVFHESPSATLAS